MVRLRILISFFQSTDAIAYQLRDNMNAFDARLIMKSHIREHFGDGVEIIDARTKVTDVGWVFFYNTKEFISTGDVMSCLMSNPPCLVSLFGKVIPLSFHLGIDEAVQLARTQYNL